MGTPEFSVPALTAVHDNGHDVVAVVTNPDRPKGRGRRVLASPVKKAADAFGYSVLQPSNVKEHGFLDTLKSLAPDLLIVVAYGQVLTKATLSIPRLGAINVHASLLPKYRGAAPIQWAIINGEKETGVTTMWMDQGLDTGDMLLSVKVPIDPEDTAQTLHDRLAEEGAGLLSLTLEKLASGSLVATPQNHLEATYARSLKKEDGHIDWTKDAVALDAFIRGMNPWPGAFTFLANKRFRIFRAKILQRKTSQPPGTVLDGFPGDLDVATGHGAFSLREVQLDSGKRLAIADFLRGCPIPPGTVLG
jgi:methionyl-tRNA formyltransferase